MKNFVVDVDITMSKVFDVGYEIIDAVEED